MYGAYLRKSRQDISLEKNSNIDTLKRHKDIIIKTANYLNIKIDTWWQEVVSAETIEDRPEVKKMLTEIEKGKYEGIFVVDVDRLARGDTSDQARISKSFSYSSTKIITPNKIYDPNNEADEEFFEFGLFMSRREYKIINKRLTRGRIASVNEGKFVASVCPYGYKKEKLPKQKGYKLVPLNKEAKVVKIIFEKACDGLGSQKIANYLNKLNIKPRKSNEWSYSTIRDIIRNPVYYGMIKWNYRKVERKIINGIIYKTRPKHDNYILVKGLHRKIISKEVFERANKISKQKEGKSIRNNNTIKNPLLGLIKCSICGRTMQRRNYKSGNFEGLICPRPKCKNIGSHLYLVEDRIVSSLKEIFENYPIIIKNYNIKNKSTYNKDILSIINSEIKKLNIQLDNTFDLVEQKIYDRNTFIKRSQLLRDKLNNLENERKKYIEMAENKSNINLNNNIPNIYKVLDNYYNLSIEDRNYLLRSIIDKVEYLKDKKGIKHKDDFNLKIILKI